MMRTEKNEKAGWQVMCESNPSCVGGDACHLFSASAGEMYVLNSSASIEFGSCMYPPTKWLKYEDCNPPYGSLFKITDSYNIPIGSCAENCQLTAGCDGFLIDGVDCKFLAVDCASGGGRSTCS